MPQAARAFARFLFFVSLSAIPAWSLNASGASAQQPAQHEHAGHEGMQMPMDEPQDPAAQARLQAKVLADKKESEFNHHLAGLFVVIAGVFMLFQTNLTKRWPAVKFVWPACFLLAGIFIL